MCVTPIHLGCVRLFCLPDRVHNLLCGRAPKRQDGAMTILRGIAPGNGMTRVNGMDVWCTQPPGVPRVNGMDVWCTQPPGAMPRAGMLRAVGPNACDGRA
jgi:hypothetical protein